MERREEDVKNKKRREKQRPDFRLFYTPPPIRERTSLSNQVGAPLDLR